MKKTKWVVFTFLGVALVGALLLMMPFSSQNHTPTPFIDAFFTSISALSSTGQTLYETALHWSFPGQLIILSLVQLGGLGLMTMVIFIFVYLGDHFNWLHHETKSSFMPHEKTKYLRHLTGMVFLYSLIIELLGASLLAVKFVPMYGLNQGLYYSIFHSISAFCNAGYSLFNGSLLDFDGSSYIILVFCSLMFLGSMGFMVVRDLVLYPVRKTLKPHTKVVLWSYLVLTVVAVALFMVGDVTQGFFSVYQFPQRLANYIFMSITPRTAGFANVDYLNISKFGLYITMALMYIGGASGSTAGGVKVTTLSVLGYSVARPKQNKVNQATINKSRFIVIASTVIIIFATVILWNTESIPGNAGLEYVLIDVFSTFSSVGLSLGLSNNLTLIGKLILILVMIVGRLGLLTIYWAFNNHKEKQGIEDNILVG